MLCGENSLKEVFSCMWIFFFFDIIIRLKVLLTPAEIQGYYSCCMLLDLLSGATAMCLVNWMIHFFPFVFQIHLAALASLKGDIVELNKRLQQTERERDLLEKTLAKAQVSNNSRFCPYFM